MVYRIFYCGKNIDAHAQLDHALKLKAQAHPVEFHAHPYSEPECAEKSNDPTSLACWSTEWDRV